MASKKCAAYYFNPRDGAILGVGVGLTSVALSLIFDPEIRKLPLEEIVSGSATIVALTTTMGTGLGYVNKKILRPLYDIVKGNTHSYS